MRAQDRRSQGLAAAVDLSVRKRGSIDAKAFFSRRGSQKRGENDMPEVYDGPQRIPDLRGQCEKRTWTLWFPPLLPFCSPVVQPAASGEFLDYSQSFPRAWNGHFCLQTVYLRANRSVLQEHSNPPQTCPGTSQHPQQAPAHQVERCITQHAATSSSGSS